jgi:hypothetical protein
MMTNPASAIKTEVCQLVDQQIETLRQPTSLNLPIFLSTAFVPRRSQASTEN